MNKIKNCIIKIKKYIVDYNIVLSTIVNITLLSIITYFFNKFNNNFLGFLGSNEGLYYNIIFTYILIYTIQTPYFQPPKDIFLNSLSILMLLIPTQSIIKNNLIYFIILLISLLFCGFSFFAMRYQQINKARFENKLFNIFVKLAVNYKILYWLAIIISTFAYDNLIDKLRILLIFTIFSSDLVLKIINDFFKKTNKNIKNIKNYGELYRIDEPNIYRIISKENIDKNKLLLLQQENKVVKLFILKNENTKDGMIYTCIKIDTINCKDKQSENNIVFEIEEIDEKDNENCKNIVGFVVENSNINSIRFELINNSSLEVSDVVYFLNKNNEKVFYQIVNGITHEEILNNNFVGNQIIEAMQLGFLDRNKKKLKKYSWLPNMNEKIYKYESEENDFISKNNKSFYIGNCHGLNLPIKIDIDKLITYHSAILGVTGTGKSTLAFKIIEEVAKNHKVICIDITGEYKIKFNNKAEMIKSSNDIKSNNGIYIYEINEIMNDKIIDNVKNFINNLFTSQKATKTNKILLVLEESHTIAPEDFFISKNNFDLKASTQAISQIALQGRKYGIGLLLISQRTALVSKTILSQCNTFFTFSLIDQTSLDFLKNFYGETQIKIIPNLEKYHLIAHGVAIESEKPIIINATNNDLDDNKINKNETFDDDIQF